MDEKKLKEEELEEVSGGGSDLAQFNFYFTMNNCFYCSKRKSGCPYGDREGRYAAFGGNQSAVCPDKT